MVDKGQGGSKQCLTLLPLEKRYGSNFITACMCIELENVH